MAENENALQQVVRTLNEALAGRLVAIYRFGSLMVSGQRAPKARLLVLVDAIDGDVLDRGAPVVALAAKSGIVLRFDRAENILRGADAFPAFSLELIETSELLAGNDVLADLTVVPSLLRLHVEQGMRGMERDLIQAYLEGQPREELIRTLRRSTRRLVFLLQGALIAARVEPPNPGTPDLVFQTVASALCPRVDPNAWATLVSFASGDHPLAGEALRGTYLSVLDVLAPLIDMVDTMATDTTPCRDR